MASRIIEKHGSGNTSLGVFTISLATFTLLTGDVLMVSLTCGELTAVASMTARGDSSGVLSSQAVLYSNDTNDTNLYVGLAVQGATPDASITVSGIGSGTSAIVWSIVQYRGVNTTTPADVATTTAIGVNGDAANPPSITPVTSGAIVVAIYAAAQGTSVAWTAPGGVIGNFVQTASTAKGRIATGDGSWTSGAFDPPAVTGGDGSVQDSWAAATVALRPTSNVFNDTISESVTSADSMAAATTFAPALSESVAGADSMAATATCRPTITENLTGNDTYAVAGTFVAPFSEGVTAADSMAGGLLLSGTVNESVTSAFALANVVTWGPTITEAVTAADSLAPVLTARPAYSEGLTAADSLAPNNVMAASIAQGVTAADSNVVAATYASALSEALTASFALTALATFNPPYVESVAAADAIAGGKVFNDTVLASVTAADAIAGGVTYNVSITETLGGAGVSGAKVTVVRL